MDPESPPVRGKWLWGALRTSEEGTDVRMRKNGANDAAKSYVMIEANFIKSSDMFWSHTYKTGNDRVRESRDLSGHMASPCLWGRRAVAAGQQRFLQTVRHIATTGKDTQSHVLKITLKKSRGIDKLGFVKAKNFSLSKTLWKARKDRITIWGKYLPWKISILHRWRTLKVQQ